MTNHWAHDAVFYHVYPLGACGAPATPEADGPGVARLGQLFAWIPHWQALGINALYLGPVFASASHGYDTSDYTQVDRRLGDNALLRELVAALHQAGIRVILDGVFNHVGRDFWAFADVRRQGPASPYADWFAGLRFGGRNRYGDPFTYESWEGHDTLVNLNLAHPGVRDHLLTAAAGWIRDFGIDGLRLDAADCLPTAFRQELAAFCRRLDPDFWLVGEVIHGDYRHYAHPGGLDATTNYECYKGLYSSHNDRNYFEIAHSLQRQFGPGGLYRGLPLYAFADNHDVDRIASRLRQPGHLYPLHILLFTMPGVPSLYYGSEWGLTGTKQAGSDAPLRPAIAAPGAVAVPHPDLAPVLARLARIRHQTPALRHGGYTELAVRPEQFAFARDADGATVVVAVNAADAACDLTLSLPQLEGRDLVDALDPTARFPVRNGTVTLAPLHPCWGRILVAA